MNTLTALDTVVERHGRDVLADPIALTGALRSLPTPPPDADVAALAAAAGSGAVAEMRAVLAADGGPEDALLAATAVAVGERAEWACRLLGTALGFLPRDPADSGGDTADIAEAATTALAEAPTTVVAGAPRRRRALVTTVGVVAALGVVAAVTVWAWPRGHADAATAKPGAGLASVTANPHPSTTTTTAPTTSGKFPVLGDPETSFADPQLLAAARPYLDPTTSKCAKDQPPTGVAASTSCILGHGYIGIFRKMLNPEEVPLLRQIWISQNASAQPGTIRVLRWEYVPGHPDMRRGIPFVTSGAGNGTRVRWVNTDNRQELYFDEDATGIVVLLSSTPGDDELLRKFWAAEG